MFDYKKLLDDLLKKPNYLIGAGAVIIVIIGLIVVMNSKAVVLSSTKNKVSYSIGLNIGNNFKRQNIEINTGVMLKGMKDALKGHKPLMTQEEMQQVMMDFQKEMMAKQSEMMQKQSVENKEKGDIFLAENAKKEGVVTTSSGLQYKILKQGTGPKPTAKQKVTVHYEGKLLDGTEFDSSYKRGEPVTFGVSEVIPGWTEALLMMPVGSKWELCVPSNLGYGEKGAGGVIGPNACLVFTIELLGIGEQKPVNKGMNQPANQPQ